MKKTSLVLVLFLSIIFLGGCSKEALTSKEFAEIVKDEGCSVTDLTDSFRDMGYKTYLDAACNNFSIQFMILSEDDAKELYKLNYDALIKEKSGTSKQKHNSSSNYENYALTCNNMYNYISRVDNTFLFVSSSEENKEIIEDLVDELGY